MRGWTLHDVHFKGIVILVIINSLLTWKWLFLFWYIINVKDVYNTLAMHRV